MSLEAREALQCIAMQAAGLAFVIDHVRFGYSKVKVMNLVLLFFVATSHLITALLLSGASDAQTNGRRSKERCHSSWPITGWHGTIHDWQQGWGNPLLGIHGEDSAMMNTLYHSDHPVSTCTLNDPAIIPRISYCSRMLVKDGKNMLKTW